MNDLAGRGVAVTRAEGARGPLTRRLAARGASVVDWAALRFGPPADPRPLELALSRLGSYDWLVVTSGRAAAALAAAAGESAPRPEGPRVAAVGRATAAELAAHGFRVDRVGAGPGAAALLASFAAAGDAAGARVLFPASAEARPEMVDGLRALGATVDRVEAYRPLPAAFDGARCRRDVEAGGVDAVLFASPSALAALAAACGEEELRELLAGLAVVSIGPTTSAALESFGRVPDAEAAPSTFDGLVEAVARHLAEARRPQRAAAATPSSGGTR